jgi:hypothetical protein
VRAEHSNLSPEERRALVERIFIKSPRFLQVREMIARCHQHSKISAEPECLLITGWQGTGKTRSHPETLLRAIKAHAR